MFDRLQFARVFENAGLTKDELAVLYGVSRQTLYGWYNGTSLPKQAVLARRADIYSKALTVVISKGVLPFPANLSKPDRDARLLKMAQSMHDLTKPK